MTLSPEVEQLFERAQAGHAASLEQLLRLQRSQVVRYAMRLCISPEDAQDAVQETLLALSRYIAALRRAAALSSWLFTAVRTHCTRLARRALRLRLRGTSDEVAAETASVEDLFVDEQLRLKLSAIVSELEPPLREVLIRRDVLEQTTEEVAAALGVTREAIKSRLHRARGGVRRQLSKQLSARSRDQR